MMRCRQENAPRATLPPSSGRSGWGDEESPLELLKIAPAHTVTLPAAQRSRLLNFLLRWEWIAQLHACLDQLIPVKPRLVSLQDLRVKAFLAEGTPGEARPVMEQRLKRRVSLPARALLARVHVALGNTRTAREMALALVEERADSALAWNLLGEIELAAGDREAALSAYRHLHGLYPHSRVYLLGMTKVYATSEDWITASGYAVALMRLAEEDNPLATGYLADLREYFQASREVTRLAEVEDELARRYKSELDVLKASLAGGEVSLPPSERSVTGAESAFPSGPLPSFEDVPVSDQEERAITHAAQELYGFNSLLPGQLETMAAVMRGEDVLTILPTGGGKSLCYQLPAIMSEACSEVGAARGTTLVISPIIALMKDQVDSLPPAVQRRATSINSTLDGGELRRRVRDLADGIYRLIYVAPERLRQPPFLHALRRAGVERMVVDEAHCVSMWGHDFRPDYLIIGRTREMLGNPPLLAMTATAPTRVRHDILARLRSPQDSADPPRVIAGDVTRPNLQLQVFRARDTDAKLQHLLALCKAESGSGIVYGDTRARCERLAALLCRYGVDASYYHAGLVDRDRVQDDFMSGRTRVVVATIAFGLGIDKPDIRFIVHFFPPASLEAYYQEAGRAGRDGLPARCLLMISPYDKALLTRRIRRDVLPIDFLREVYAAVQRRLGRRSSGRIVRADLERDLRTDETRVRVALSILEEAELLSRGCDVPRAATLCLSSVCREEALPPDLAAFCQAARLRPQQSLSVDLSDIALQADIALAELERKLLAWDEEGWLTYHPVGRDLLVELRPAPENAAERVSALLDRYEKVQVQRVDEIAAYAETKRCRHGHINAYLGGRAIEVCNACDNCVEIPPLPDPGLPDEATQLLAILQCMRNAPWSWGRNTLVRILRGDDQQVRGRRPLHDKARAQNEFGALAFRSGTAVERLVGYLESEGFLASRRLAHGGVVLDLTGNGRLALEDSALLH